MQINEVGRENAMSVVNGFLFGIGFTLGVFVGNLVLVALGGHPIGC